MAESAARNIHLDLLASPVLKVAQNGEADCWDRGRRAAIDAGDAVARVQGPIRGLPIQKLLTIDLVSFLLHLQFYNRGLFRGINQMILVPV